MAYQPIVNLTAMDVYGYEALVRSAAGDSAMSVIGQVARKDFYQFDKFCRSQAIHLAIRYGLLEMDAQLCINVNPRAAVEEDSHLRLTCEEAVAAGFPMNRLTLEFVEDEEISDLEGMRQLVQEYKQQGAKIAIDDFGSGYSGLKVLANLMPDVVKIDMSLTRRLDVDRPTQVILRAVVSACIELGIEVIAEGIERYEQSTRLVDMGVFLQQGYLFGVPSFESLTQVDFAPIRSGLSHAQVVQQINRNAERYDR